MPRGAAVPATVGLGSARTFATAPAHGSFQAGANNVPVVLRAFAQIFDDDDKYLPSATRYTPYVRRPRKGAKNNYGRGPRAPRRHRRESTASISSNTSSILREIGHYFPVVLAPVDEEVPLPPCPEDLVTPGVTATLALPLSPSLNALLEPTARIPYADAEIGVAILAQLTAGLLPLHDAYAAAGARVIPLLAKLENLGVLDVHTYPPTTLEVACNYRGEPDILRIVFAGRSTRDVRALLGDLLDAEGWWTLSQARQAIVPLEDEDEAKRHWVAEPIERAERVSRSINAAPTSASTASLASSVDLDLVMPTLDMSVAPTVTPSMYDSAFDDSYVSPESTWPPSAMSMSLRSSPSESGMSTPYSYSAGVDSWTSSATPSSPASLLSSLASLDDYYSDREWISPPSEADADLDAWSDAGIDHATTLEAATPGQVEEVEMFWVGGGLSLTQSW